MLRHISHGPRYLYVRQNAMKVQRLEKGADYCSPSIDPYRLIVISNDKTLTNGDIERLADQITATPVKLVAAWGHNCSFWDDAVDWSVIRRNPKANPEICHVTTTWHEDESIADVFEFVTTFQVHDDGSRNNVHLVVIGSTLVPPEQLEPVLAALSRV